MLHFVAPYSSGRFYAAHVEETIVTYNLIYYILRFKDDGGVKSGFW